MKRGQIGARLLIILASWVVLIVFSGALLIYQQYTQPTPPSTAQLARGTAAQASLASYLRQTVSLNGQSVPMAELIAASTLANDFTAVQTKTDAFLKGLRGGDLREIVITLPDGTKKEYGESLGFLARVGGAYDLESGRAEAQIPLPTGQSVTITYIEKEVNVAQTGGIP
jgi:hypothetical protein